MMQGRTSRLGLGLLLLVTLALVVGLRTEQLPISTSADANEVRATYGRLPLSFEANQGQTDPQVTFLSRGRGFTLFLTSSKAVLTLRRAVISAAQDVKDAARAVTQARGAGSVPVTVLQMELHGANPDRRLVGLGQLPGTSNYIIGSDPAKWRRNVPHYKKVLCEDLYPGIDLVYYGTNERQLEFDFVVSPGADPAAITLEFEGTDSLEVDGQGHLVLHLPDGALSFRRPHVYQEVRGATREIGGAYSLQGDRQVAFEVGPYDASKPLVIDPLLSYSTYLGSEGWEDLYDIAVDSHGSAYVTGMLFSPTFPKTFGAFDPTCGTSSDCNWNGTRNFSDAFVAKLSPDGSSLVYSTFLGGADQEFGLDIAVDAGGNAYVTGQTGSTADFPLMNAFQTVHGGGACTLTDGYGPVTSPCDVFVVKLNPTGSELLYSSYLGGSREEEGDAIVVDASGNAYVTGRTNSSDFPLRNPLQGSLGGGTCGTDPDTYPCRDAFVAKIDPSKSGAASLVYSTYLGGSDNENGNAIAIDSSGNIYVAGATFSADFVTTPGAFQRTCTLDASGQCAQNAFVTKLDATGSNRTYSTLLGGSGRDGILGITVDSVGSAYVGGWTNSTDFPTTPNALDATCGTDGLCDVPYYDAFVAKLNAAGSGLIWSTYLGGDRGEAVEDIAVDSFGIAYVAGGTASPDFPRNKAIDDACGRTEAFVAKLSANGAGLIFSTFLGGSDNEAAKGIAVDAFRDVYVGGYTTSQDFTATPGAYDTVYGADGSYGEWMRDGFIAKLSDLALPLVVTSAQSVDFGQQPVGTTSSPQMITVTNIGDAAQPIPPIDITGDFAHSHTCGTSIAPGSTCAIAFTFSPTAMGTRTGGMLIYDEEGEEWLTAIPLTGIGTAPYLSISPASLLFPPQPVGRTSSSQPVTVRNAGSAPLTITGATTVSPFAQTNNCLTSIPVGSSCTIWVTFTPRSAVTYVGSLTISSDAPNSPYAVALQGSGYVPAPPLLRVSPTSLNFGVLPRNQARTIRLYLGNSGGSTLTLRAADVAGPYFHIPDIVRFCGSTLEPGRACYLPVAFSGPNVGTYRSTLSIYSNAQGPSPYRVTLIARVQ